LPSERSSSSAGANGRPAHGRSRGRLDRTRLPLTDRELEVLQCLPTRMSIEEVGAALSISPNTVKTHLRSIYQKLGVRSRNEAIRIGCDQRLVAPQARWLLAHEPSKPST
jgi:ATP/maltotriose-dependent transcriptional regulator MalT